MKIHKKLNKVYRFKKKLKKLSNKKNINEDYKEKLKTLTSNMNVRTKKLKEQIYLEFNKNMNIRSLNETSLNNRNVISIFDSVLTRTLNIQTNTLSYDIFVVQTYFFDILKDIIINGFMYGNERYVFFTASAGQIRTKKTVFIKECILKENQKSLMCGLTVESINENGGMNINKYLAYLALCNSATDIWKEFDIDKTIVVEDLETDVLSEVDFIDDKTYEITRKEMDIPINHTDGCGMVLPKLIKKSMMIRLPWVKGLIVPFPFDRFIREENNKNKEKNCGLIVDIYGKQYDIINDGIEIILTKSQFKMYKFYSSWDEYKNFYKQYNCHAGKCNEEESIFSKAKINYQMLQTLTDMSEIELKEIIKKTKKNVVTIGSDKEVMLRVIGVTESNDKKNYIQQALDIYPELLNDTYSKEILKQVKKSMVKDSRSGKIDIDGFYTFICPDLYAFSEFLFLGNRMPEGLLKNGEIYCKLYKNEEKLDCLRSPHLYREHAVRSNVVDKNKANWFITRGIYTSCLDTISKILMFDNDGDKSLVVAEKTIIEVAERNMNGIVPLFYNMAKAEVQMINYETIYDGLKAAYTGGNIGVISNDITKIWNSREVNYDVVKLLCMENNFTIDYAKTLYKPKRPNSKKKMITKFTKSKVPHFFIYAKDKKKTEVEQTNNSLVNRLERLIPNPRINFRATNLGKFNYQMLMNDCDVKTDQKIINKYTELDLKSHFMINVTGESDNLSHVHREIRNEILKIHSNIIYVVDVLVRHLYLEKNSQYKTTLWECFGDILVDNLKKNLEATFKEDTILCESCGTRIEVTSNRRKYCDSCWKDKEKELWRESKRKSRNSKKYVQV